VTWEVAASCRAMRHKVARGHLVDEEEFINSVKAQHVMRLNLIHVY
jgi:hypothetical protein